MKHLNRVLQGLIFLSITLLVSCSQGDSVKLACLPNQFPFDDGAYVSASYNTKNRLVQLTYNFEDIDDKFQSIRYYDNKQRILQIDFYVNGNVSEDFVRVNYVQDTVKENYYRTTANEAGLMSYRYYYVNEEDKIYSYTEHFKEDLFERKDSVAFTYTNDNVTTMTVYDADDNVTDTYTLTYDSNISPYYKSKFSGSEFLYSYLNLSVNNPLTITHVELAETTTYTYTYSENKGYPLTRLNTAEITPEEFKYTCDNP